MSGDVILAVPESVSPINKLTGEFLLLTTMIYRTITLLQSCRESVFAPRQQMVQRPLLVVFLLLSPDFADSLCSIYYGLLYTMSHRLWLIVLKCCITNVMAQYWAVIPISNFFDPKDLIYTKEFIAWIRPQYRCAINGCSTMYCNIRRIFQYKNLIRIDRRLQVEKND